MTLAMFVGVRRQRIVVPVGRRQLTGYIVICNNSVLKYLGGDGKPSQAFARIPTTSRDSCRFNGLMNCTAARRGTCDGITSVERIDQ